MNSKQKKMILLAVSLIALWITTAPSTSVSTPPLKLTRTPLVLPEPAQHSPTATTTTTQPTIRRPRRIPDAVQYRPSETTTTTAAISTVEFTLRQIVCSKPWPCEEALTIAQCESELTARAISPPNKNGTRDWGLMQINDGAWAQAFPTSWPNVLDPQTNVDMAWHIYSIYGWAPWTCRP